MGGRVDTDQGIGSSHLVWSRWKMDKSLLRILDTFHFSKFPLELTRANSVR